MKKIDKYIFATMTAAWTFPIIFIHKSLERWYVYNALANAFTWILSIGENFKNLPIDNVIFNILSLITAVIFIIYLVRVLMHKPSSKLSLVLEFSCFVIFCYKLYNVVRFFSYGEVYPPYAIVLEMVAIFFYFVSFALTIYTLIKFPPHRPSKTEQMQAQIDELQKQVDELKKGE